MIFMPKRYSLTNQINPLGNQFSEYLSSTMILDFIAVVMNG